MRLDIPGGAWIELRGPDELTGGDDDAFQRVYSAAFAQDVEISDGDDDMEMSADGASMVPKAKPKRTIRVTMDMVAEQRDILLSRLITGVVVRHPAAVQLGQPGTPAAARYAGSERGDQAAPRRAARVVRPKSGTSDWWHLREWLTGRVRERPAGLTPQTARYCLMLRKYGLKPWEVDALPLGVARWLDPIDYTLTAIERGQ